MAIRAHLTNDQLDDITLRNASRLATYGVDCAAVRNAVAQCRVRGYATTSIRMVPGLGVMGMAIPRLAGGAVAALALIGPIHRFSGPQAARAAAILQNEAARLSALPALHGGLTQVAQRHGRDSVSTGRKGQPSSP